MEYSNDEGSETASIIIDRLINQASFFLMVEEVPVRVVAVDCTNCKSITNNIISPAAASLSGLFIGGFVTGAIIVAVLIMTVIM